jgi:hypothetical protein
MLACKWRLTGQVIQIVVRTAASRYVSSLAKRPLLGRKAAHSLVALTSKAVSKGLITFDRKDASDHPASRYSPSEFLTHRRPQRPSGQLQGSPTNVEGNVVSIAHEFA